VTKLATIHFDGGGLKPGPVTAACVVELSDGPYGAYAERFDEGTHNTAEYHALILGLRMALAHGARDVKAYGDSQLVVNQIKGTSKTKHPGCCHCGRGQWSCWRSSSTGRSSGFGAGRTSGPTSWAG
jgi:ribonuclease HI